MRKVGIYSTSGDKHTRLRNQMRRLFGCTVSLLYEDARGEATEHADCPSHGVLEDKLIEARERAVKAGHAKKYPDVGKAT